MEDAAPDGDAAPAANAAAILQQEDLATESADGAAAVIKEEAEEAQAVAPAGAAPQMPVGSHDQHLSLRSRRPWPVKSQGLLK